MSLLFWCFEIQVNKFSKTNDIIIPRACNLFWTVPRIETSGCLQKPAKSAIHRLIVKSGNPDCVVPENIHTPPTEGNWNFRRGGGSLGKSLPWGGMDIFWNHTLAKNTEQVLCACSKNWDKPEVSMLGAVQMDHNLWGKE